MASSVATTLHSALANFTVTPAKARGGFVGRSGVVQDGSTVNTARPGILPGASTPLFVSQSSTPAMSVKVKAGTVIQKTADSPGGVYCHTLTTDTDLTIATAPSSNSRWDVVVAKVFDDGTTPASTIEVLTGTAAASPTYPSALTSPPANTYYYPLAKVVVGTSVSSIVNANISFPAAGGGLPTFGQFTVSPGGLVPVANLTAAAALPLYSPFYSVADRSTGRVLPTVGASLDGHQQRYIEAFGVATNGSGDVTVSFGLWLAGTWAAVPFPNGCFNAFAHDASSIVTVDVPLLFKQPRNAYGLSASQATFRVYRSDDSKYVSSGLDVTGYAIGW